MSKTMQEYECQCGYKLWSRCKPPKPGVFIFKAPLCPNCHRPQDDCPPARVGTGTAAMNQPKQPNKPRHSTGAGATLRSRGLLK